MKSNDALISTVLLKTFQSDCGKDYTNLIKPFVLNIISKKYNVGDIIDTTYIHGQLKKEYSFNDIPIAILKKAIKRLKSDGTLKDSQLGLILKGDLSKDTENFKKSIEETKKEVNYVLKGIKEFILEKDGKEISIDEAESYLTTFIEIYGYNTYKNVMSLHIPIEKKRDNINYLIGEFIKKEHENDTILFRYILKIIEGYMLANVIYLQIDGNSKPSLRGVQCYLDAPLILKIFGYKTDEENQMGQELLKQLKKYGATIKCFYHTYNEVEGILRNYRNNINKTCVSTLEYFDKMNNPAIAVELALDGLKNTFNNSGIYIEEKPSLDSNNQKYNIDCAALEAKLKAYKKEHRGSYSERSIENDVNSVRSINIIRKGQYALSFEKCNSLFITPFYYLVKATNEVTKIAEKSSIGLAINDSDLTSILWFKDLEKNSDLPKMRLIENARAATLPSEEIMAKVIKTVDEIKEKKLISMPDGAELALSSTYLVESGYLDVVKNDEDMVNQESLINHFKKLQEKTNDLERTKERILLKTNQVKERYINEFREKSELIKKRWTSCLKIVLYVVMAILIIGIIYFGMLINKFSFKNIPLAVFSVLDFLGILSIVLSLKRLNQKIERIATKKASIYLNKKIEETEEKFND